MCWSYSKEQLFGLIEAYWNVNNISDERPNSSVCGLIEAYWNVNIIHFILVLTYTQGFNRSILKCKFYTLPRLRNVLLGLIEAYWNVNKNKSSNRVVQLPGLIEAYWNVNTLCGLRPCCRWCGLIEAYWNVNLYGCSNKNSDVAV